MDLLQEARVEIDQIDQEMASLFLRRMTAVKKVVTHKMTHDLPIFDREREGQVIAKNLSLFPEEEIKPFYQEFVESNMAISRAYQSKVMAKDKVGYQGVAGAFSHIAAKSLFPLGKEQAFPTWGAVVDAVEEESISFGVLPFENSHAGDVSEVLDLCFTHPSIHVTAMYDLPIQQNLLAIEGARLQDIKTVVSHPQALRQSAIFIDTIGAIKQEYPNTAMAAEYVAQQQDKSLGAIASSQTAELYGLQILAPHINEDEDNTTRFLVIGKTPPVEGNRFCLLFTVKNEAGSLAKVIAMVAEEGFNMESIKSRPMPLVSWEYYFYMELVGSGAQALALQEKLAQVCQSIRILGVYEREERG